jgi:flavin reductase (DIM6/NTAB) family NADH-FMN oxidoreductase RutF
MRKDFGKKAIITPLPVLIIATYNEDGSANAMNAAWGGQREDDQITICLGTSHKTVENLKKRKAFTVSFGTRKTEIVSDFFGIVSGKKLPNKVEKSGLHVMKSANVDAPMFEEYPLTLESDECFILADQRKGTEDSRFFGPVKRSEIEGTVISVMRRTNL